MAPLSSIPRGFFGISSKLPTGSHRVGSQGLVLAYDMEHAFIEGGPPKMYDFSGQGNHGMLTGTTDVAGQFGRARDFDGVDDFIQIADSPSWDPPANTLSSFVAGDRLRTGFREELIVKRDLGGNETMFGFDFLPDNRLELYARLNHATGVGFLIRRSVATFGTGTFEIAASVDLDSRAEDDYVRLYSGGLRIPLTDEDFGIIPTNAPHSFRLNNHPVWLGREVSIDDFARVREDEVLAFTRALSDAEIQALSLDGRTDLRTRAAVRDLGTARPRVVA